MAAVDPGDFVARIRSVVGPEPAVPLHVPDIAARERQYVDECLESTYVSSVGPFVTRLEEDLAAYTGAAAAVAVSNGTVALQVALTLAGVRDGDAVVVPALSFIATANAVVHAGASPVFLDSDDTTLGLSADALEAWLASCPTEAGVVLEPSSRRRVAAIVPMHTLGHPAEIERIVTIADSFGIPVVEDAAESLGSYVDGRHTGTFGRVSIVSFNGNKIATTGGGGAILTNDLDLARRAKHLTTTAKLPHAWEFEHDAVAFNFRMPNLNAALGVAQVERLGEFVAAKRRLAERYAHSFAALDGVEFLSEPPGTTSNYWLCAVRVDGGIEVRNELLAAANAAGLQCRPLWNLLSDQAPYRDAPRGELATARGLHESVICIPSSAVLGAP